VAKITRTLREEARAATRSLQSLLTHTTNLSDQATVRLELDALTWALREHKFNPCPGTHTLLQTCYNDSRVVFCRLSGATP